jgi:hypothetical protein
MVDSNNWSALHVACLAPHHDVVQVLLSASPPADPNLKTAGSMTTPLHYLVRHTYSPQLEQSIRLLLSKGASLESRNNYGETPLHYAVMKGSEEVTALLLRLGAEVNSRNDFNETALHKAVRHGVQAKGLVRLLLQAGADPTIEGRNGTAYQLIDSQNAELRELFPAALRERHALPPAPVAVPGGAGTGADSLSAMARAQQEADLMSRMRASALLPVRLAALGPPPVGPPPPIPSAAAENDSASAAAAAAGTEESEFAFLEAEGALGPPLISPAPGFRLELGKRNPLQGVELNLYDYTDHYRNSFLGRRQLNFVGYARQEAEDDPIVVTVLEEPETGKFPEPVYRGMIRTARSGQDQFFLPVSEIAQVRLDKRELKEARQELKQAGLPMPADKQEAPLHARLKKHLQEVFFMSCRLWFVPDCAALEPELLELERNDPERSNCFAFGVVYAREGQRTALEYWENEHGSPAFDHFLTLLGDRIELRGWSGFRGGLDVHKDTKGTHSVYTKFQEFEIMYHVSTLLPYHPADPLKLVRARQIQNDVVMVIFQEGQTTYAPEAMPTNVAHIFAVVRPFRNPRNPDETLYQLGFVSKANVNAFRPDLPYPPVFRHDESFRRFLLTKLINGQIAARKSGLQMMFTRPRQAMLQEIVQTFRPQDRGSSRELRKTSSLRDVKGAAVAKSVPQDRSGSGSASGTK